MFANALTLALAALALCGTSTAHMKIKTPVPYGNTTLDTSPLTGSGDYPCKQNNRKDTVYQVSAPNPMAVGEPQTLSFDGSASHGGGTCQLAVSLDKEPTADSIFKIIQVYTGGCPTTGEGNDGSNNFTYSIPKGFPNGDATFAWVWNNKVGNREIYMNCAPITVSGGSDSNDYYNTLPNLYLVNDPVNPSCTVPDSMNVIIPTPGSFVTTLESTSLVSATGNTASCSAAAAAQTSGVSGGASGYGGSSATASASASSSAQPTSAAGYGGTGASSASASAYSSSAAPTAYSAASSTSAQASVTSTFPSTNPAPGEGVYGPATTAASVAAPAGTGSGSFGILCDAAHAGEYGQMVNGKAVWRAVAAGTTCSEVRQYRKRSALRHAHVRRHVQNAAIRHGA